jgi:hypothetical protein
MTSNGVSVRHRRCRFADLGIGDGRDAAAWLAGEVLLASAGELPDAAYLLAAPEAVLSGEDLTAFLGRVAPFGCPPPPSLIRAYSLPDAPFPSILLREHEGAPRGMGEAYARFVAQARPQWLAALQGTGPGLCPVVAWQTAHARRFTVFDEWIRALDQAGMPLRGVPDTYLGRGLLLLAHPILADSWETLMSLGGVTKARKITGREFPVWVDLPAHQPALLASPLLAKAERLLAAP